MECFSVDESGYTGFDLLNANQPMQGASAISITHEQASSLIKKHFPRLQATELKYSAVARRPGNAERLLALQRDLLSDHKCVTYVCDKRYLLLLMFADYAVEPFYYERGLDFYQDGQNYAMASLLYFVGPTLLGIEAFNRLLDAFQAAMRSKTSEALDALVSQVQSMKWNELPEILGPIAKASPEVLAAIATPGVSTDAAFIVLQSLINRTEVMAEGPYRIEHDRSDNLLNYHALLQRYISHDVRVEFKQSEIARIKFPLKLVSATQVDSKSSPPVQLADVLVGAAIDAAKSFRGSPDAADYAQKVVGQYAEHQLIHMLPSLDFHEQKEFRKGTEAGKVIDYFASKFGG